MNILLLSYTNNLNFEGIFKRNTNVHTSHKEKCVSVS